MKKIFTLAMTVLALAVLAAPTGDHRVDDAACAAISYPNFEHDWRALQVLVPS